MPDTNYDREVSVTLTLREWQSIFGALGDTLKEQKARRKALWPDAASCMNAAYRARRRVREQLKGVVEL